jgi:hypothetical protein
MLQCYETRMNKALTGMLLGGLWATDAWAFDEVVNPAFCYRIDVPAEVAPLAKRTDSGVTITLGTDCAAGTCVRVEVTARAMTTGKPAANERQTASKPSEHVYDGVVWQKRATSHGAQREVLFQATDYAAGIEKAVRVTSPVGTAAAAKRLAEHIVLSWKSLSECV